jgi:creatinine amidohydrolase
MALALFPGLCRPELARGVVPELPPHVDVKWTFSELTDCGASGDPTRATAEKGGAMREAIVEALAGVLRSLDACGWDYRSPGIAGDDARHMP